MTIVRTERLVLRKAQASDLPAMHEAMRDPATMRYWSTPPHQTMEETSRWLDAMIAGAGDDFVITLEGRVIGKAGLYKDPEVGFLLHPAFTGKGYATEAVRAVCERGLLQRGLEHIVADVDPRNDPSLRLLRRLGFEETGRAEGTWQVGDELCDSVYLELTASRLKEDRT